MILAGTVVGALIYQMVNTQRPLEEKIVLWRHVFAIADTMASQVTVTYQIGDIGIFFVRSGLSQTVANDSTPACSCVN